MVLPSPARHTAVGDERELITAGGWRCSTVAPMWLTCAVASKKVLPTGVPGWVDGGRDVTEDYASKSSTVRGPPGACQEDFRDRC